MGDSKDPERANDEVESFLKVTRGRLLVFVRASFSTLALLMSLTEHLNLWHRCIGVLALLPFECLRSRVCRHIHGV